MLARQFDPIDGHLPLALILMRWHGDLERGVGRADSDDEIIADEGLEWRVVFPSTRLYATLPRWVISSAMVGESHSPA